MALAVDKGLIGRRFRRSFDTYDGAAVVQRAMAGRLIRQLRERCPTPVDRLLEIGCGTGLLTAHLLESLRPRELFVNDMVPQCAGLIEQMAADHRAVAMRFLEGDIEKTDPLPGNLDVVAANAVFHWVSDLERLVKRIGEALRPGGLVAFSTFGPKNMEELRSLAGVSLEYPDAESLTNLLSRRFTLLHHSEETVRLEFSAPREVLRHLRETGSNGLRPERWLPSRFRDFEKRYGEEYSREGRVELTYHPMIFVAERKG